MLPQGAEDLRSAQRLMHARGAALTGPPIKIEAAGSAPTTSSQTEQPNR